MNKKSMIFISIVVSILPLLIAGYFLYHAFQPTKIEIIGETLSIGSPWGEEVPLDSINSIVWLDEIPHIMSRTNGSAIGTQLKGNFRMVIYGDVKLFMDTAQKGFIKIETDQRIILFNLSDRENTYTFYEILINKIQT